MTTKNNAALGAKTGAALKVDHRSNLNAATYAAQCEKALYVTAYCHGALSFATLVRLFQQHPEWRAA